ncbi:type IV secretory system conjugative DNA transfer family protein [Micrococcus luteus]|uniref:type IV secretory system conjugative DNA transfer family protein n=1 Tax=Micrococcus luteus TaxID=1270 RepID=UPI003814C413
MDIITGILRFLWDILAATSHLWAPIVITAALLAAAARFGIPAAARAWDRRKRGISKELHTELTALLSNRKIIQTYAPAAQFVTDVAEGTRRPRTNAWLSPYARAVKATVKRQGRTPRTQFFDARAQIRHAADNVTIRPLNDDEQRLILTDDPARAYAIDLAYDGKPKDDIKALEPVIRTQLGLKVVETVDTGDPYTLTLIVSKDTYRDPLEQANNGFEFFREHPAATPMKLPMAVTSSGDVWSLPTHHTLIYGLTGSGKSGPIIASIIQLAPFVRKGRVKLYAIDPKREDLYPFLHTGLFERIATTREEITELLQDYESLLNDRINGGTSSKAALHVLFMDEAITTQNMLSKDRDGKAALISLENVITMGRSNGFYMYFASVIGTVEKLGTLRAQCVNQFVFRQDSQHINDVMLGAGAAERGYDSRTIRKANVANGYATSGIGYTVKEDGDPVKIRMAYASKEDLRDFINANTPEGKPHVRIHSDENGKKLVHERTGLHTVPYDLAALDSMDVADDFAPLPALEPLTPLGREVPRPLTKRRTPPDMYDDLPDE